jgi:hypothetical protein
MNYFLLSRAQRICTCLQHASFIFILFGVKRALCLVFRIFSSQKRGVCDGSNKERLVFQQRNKGAKSINFQPHHQTHSACTYIVHTHSTRGKQDKNWRRSNLHHRISRARNRIVQSSHNIELKLCTPVDNQQQLTVAHFQALVIAGAVMTNQQNDAQREHSKYIIFWACAHQKKKQGCAKLSFSARKRWRISTGDDEFIKKLPADDYYMCAAAIIVMRTCGLKGGAHVALAIRPRKYV